MRKALTHIGSLRGITSESKAPKRGAEMRKVESISNAYLIIEDGKILDFGPMDQVPESDEQYNCEGRMVIPAFIDSHTHAVFAQSRSAEFAMRLAGKSYHEIAEAGGGILNSAKSLRAESGEDLYKKALYRLNELEQQGSRVFEIKSGYGLTVEPELKMLRVIRQLKEESPYLIKSTYLAAHALPPDFRDYKKTYVQMMADLIPMIAEEGLADYIDMFCEKGYFDLEDMDLLLSEGKKYGLKGKVHVNQFTAFGGVKRACDLGALSVDHLEVMEEADFKALEESETLAVGLPLCSLFLKIPYAPGREIIDRNIAFVLASDFNPGSSPSGNLKLAMSLACTQMGLLPEEAFNALSYNAAFALELEESVGSIQKGKRAMLNILKPKYRNLADLAYWMGEEAVDVVV